MREYNLALDASMTPDQYRDIVKQIRKRRGLVLLVLDIMDFPHSAILNQLTELIGDRRPLYVVANKVDLLPQDSKRYLQRVKWMIEDEIESNMTFDQSAYIRHIALVSAKTGYGIEDLVTKLIKQWAGNGRLLCSILWNKIIMNGVLGCDFVL